MKNDWLTKVINTYSQLEYMVLIQYLEAERQIVIRALLSEVCLASDFRNTEEVDVWTFGLRVVSHHVSCHPHGPSLIPYSDDTAQREKSTV